MGGGFLWFFIGAGAATMYSNAKRNRNPENDSEWGWGRCHGHFGRDRAAQALNPPPPTTSSNVSELQTPPASLPFAPIPSGSGTSAIADPWTAEKERVRDIGKQVGVNVRVVFSSFVWLLTNELFLLSL